MEKTTLRDKLAHKLCQLVMRHIATPEYRNELGFITSLGMAVRGSISDIEKKDLTDQEESGTLDS